MVDDMCVEKGQNNFQQGPNQQTSHPKKQSEVIGKAKFPYYLPVDPTA